MNFSKSILKTLVLFFLIQVTTAHGQALQCSQIFSLDNRLAPISSIIRFSQTPATKEYLDQAQEELNKTHIYTSFESPRFKEAYKKSISFDAWLMSKAAQMTEREAAENADIKNLTLHPAEVAAIRIYTGEDYRSINNALRSENWTSYGLQIELLNSALTRLRLRSTWLHRHSGKPENMRETNADRFYKLNTLDPKELAEFLSRYQEGQYVTEKSFTSTTVNSNRYSLYITGNVLFKIRTKSGVYIGNYSSANSKGDKLEAEVLIPPNTRFFVKKVTYYEKASIKYVIEMVEEGLEPK